MKVNLSLTTLPKDIFVSTSAEIKHNLIYIKERLNDFISYTGYIPDTSNISKKDMNNYSLKDFYPLKFLDHNSASDQGLYEILNYIFQKKQDIICLYW